MPAGVSCLCHYDDMLPIGPDNLTHTHKSWLFSHDAEAAASLAASLGIPHSAEGMVVAGCMFVCVYVCVTK